METKGYGAGTVSFYWKVSSEEDCDYLEFYIDDELQDSVSGEVDWVQKQYNVSGSGAHVFRWQYVKDYSGDDGEDRAWVDYLQWTGAGEPPEQSGDWETITYVYDPAGRRIAKAIDGDVAVRYLYDGIYCIAEYDGDDVLLRKFIYGPGVDQPICMVEASGTYAGAYYYHFDGLGSVVALSDADGETVQTYEYSVYGEPAASDPNHPNPFLFTARRFDRETGLYHYRARAYNPFIGRFLQTDPANSGMNAYAYCGNDPVNMVDPLGLEHYNVFYGQHGNWENLWWELTAEQGAWDVAGLWFLFGGPGKVLVSKTFYPVDYPLDDDTITVYTLIDASPEGWNSSTKQPVAYPIADLGAFLGKFMNSTTLKGYFLTELTRALENTSGWEVVAAPNQLAALPPEVSGPPDTLRPILIDGPAFVVPDPLGPIVGGAEALGRGTSLAVDAISAGTAHGEDANPGYGHTFTQTQPHWLKPLLNWWQPVDPNTLRRNAVRRYNRQHGVGGGR